MNYGPERLREETASLQGLPFLMVEVGKPAGFGDVKSVSPQAFAADGEARIRHYAAPRGAITQNPSPAAAPEKKFTVDRKGLKGKLPSLGLN